MIMAFEKSIFAESFRAKCSVAKRSRRIPSLQYSAGFFGFAQNDLLGERHF